MGRTRTKHEFLRKAQHFQINLFKQDKTKRILEEEALTSWSQILSKTKDVVAFVIIVPPGRRSKPSCSLMPNQRGGRRSGCLQISTHHPIVPTSSKKNPLQKTLNLLFLPHSISDQTMPMSSFQNPNPRKSSQYSMGIEIHVQRERERKGNESDRPLLVERARNPNQDEGVSSRVVSLSLP